MRYENKVAVVTGAAGGVGQTLVRKLADEGAAVVLSDLAEEKTSRLAQEIRDRQGRAVHLAGDIREPEYCGKLVELAEKEFGRLDIVANNAGIIPRGTILETTDDMWHTALDVNLTAMFYICRAAIPLMKANGGTIINTSSVWGVYPGPGHIAYCTSKGAVASFTKSLGRDHAPDGIRVNAVCPPTRSIRRCSGPDSSGVVSTPRALWTTWAELCRWDVSQNQRT